MDEADLFALDRAATHQLNSLEDTAAARGFSCCCCSNVPLLTLPPAAWAGKHPSQSPHLGKTQGTPDFAAIKSKRISSMFKDGNFRAKALRGKHSQLWPRAVFSALPHRMSNAQVGLMAKHREPKKRECSWVSPHH